jgi:hypothetical protein
MRCQRTLEQLGHPGDALGMCRAVRLDDHRDPSALAAVEAGYPHRPLRSSTRKFHSETHFILRCPAQPGLEGCSSGSTVTTILRGSLRSLLRMRLYRV